MMLWATMLAGDRRRAARRRLARGRAHCVVREVRARRGAAPPVPGADGRDRLQRGGDRVRRAEGGRPRRAVPVVAAHPDALQGVALHVPAVPDARTSRRGRSMRRARPPRSPRTERGSSCSSPTRTRASTPRSTRSSARTSRAAATRRTCSSKIDFERSLSRTSAAPLEDVGGLDHVARRGTCRARLCGPRSGRTPRPRRTPWTPGRASTASIASTAARRVTLRWLVTIAARASAARTAATSELDRRERAERADRPPRGRARRRTPRVRSCADPSGRRRARAGTAERRAAPSPTGERARPARPRWPGAHASVSQTPAFHRLPISRIAGKRDIAHRLLDAHRLRASVIRTSRSFGGVEPHRRAEEPIEQLGVAAGAWGVGLHDVDRLARRCGPA